MVSTEYKKGLQSVIIYQHHIFNHSPQKIPLQHDLKTRTDSHKPIPENHHLKQNGL